MVISFIFILSTTSCITEIGQGLPAIIPVLIYEKSVFGKSGCSKRAINIVGTPWNAVILSALMQAKAGFGEKYGSGKIVPPCVIVAVIARTIPKQWNIGT